MSSHVTNCNSSTAQEIVNWVMTADGCVYTARRRDSTRQLSRVGVEKCVMLTASEIIRHVESKLFVTVNEDDTDLQASSMHIQSASGTTCQLEIRAGCVFTDVG